MREGYGRGRGSYRSFAVGSRGVPSRSGAGGAPLPPRGAVAPRIAREAPDGAPRPAPPPQPRGSPLVAASRPLALTGGRRAPSSGSRQRHRGGAGPRVTRRSSLLPPAAAAAAASFPPPARLPGRRRAPDARGRRRDVIVPRRAVTVGGAGRAEAGAAARGTRQRRVKRGRAR